MNWTSVLKLFYCKASDLIRDIFPFQLNRVCCLFCFVFILDSSQNEAIDKDITSFLLLLLSNPPKMKATNFRNTKLNLKRA